MAQPRLSWVALVAKGLCCCPPPSEPPAFFGRGRRDEPSPWYLPPLTDPSPGLPLCLSIRLSSHIPSAVPSLSLPVFLAAVGLSLLSWHLSCAINHILLSWCHTGLSCRDSGAGDCAGGGAAAPCPGCPGVTAGAGGASRAQHPADMSCTGVPWLWGPGAPSPQRDHGVGSWDGGGGQ